MFGFLHRKVVHGLHVVHVKPVGHEHPFGISIESIVDLEQFDPALASMILPSNPSHIMRNSFSFKILELPLDEVVDVYIQKGNNNMELWVVLATLEMTIIVHDPGVDRVCSLILGGLWSLASCGHLYLI